ncbi:MAG: hypothetical protein PVJ38_04705 [Candidatus Bathyarchaeota archaeon]|jgi:hypothetical protein
MDDTPSQSESGFDPSGLDRRSYNLGMIYAFVEVVASGCKRLALSPALTCEEFEEIWEDAVIIAREYGVLLEVDESFLTTRLFNPRYTEDKNVIHIAAERETLEEYRGLKELKRSYIEKGGLTEEAELEIAWGLGRLLSYSDEAIEGLLERPRF